MCLVVGLVEEHVRPHGALASAHHGLIILNCLPGATGVRPRGHQDVALHQGLITGDDEPGVLLNAMEITSERPPRLTERA